jgi:hypothetical protein
MKYPDYLGELRRLRLEKAQKKIESEQQVQVVVVDEDRPIPMI